MSVACLCERKPSPNSGWKWVKADIGSFASSCWAVVSAYNALPRWSCPYIIKIYFLQTKYSRLSILACGFINRYKSVLLLTYCAYTYPNSENISPQLSRVDFPRCLRKHQSSAPGTEDLSSHACDPHCRADTDGPDLSPTTPKKARGFPWLFPEVPLHESLDKLPISGSIRNYPQPPGPPPLEYVYNPGGGPTPGERSKQGAAHDPDSAWYTPRVGTPVARATWWSEKISSLFILFSFVRSAKLIR